MKKSDLRAIILEEVNKIKKELLLEKFASSTIATIHGMMDAQDSRDLWNATANTYGVAWDQVQDKDVEEGVNPRKGYLNIFFVEKGTKNPYANDSYGYGNSFWRGGLLGITIGKKVQGVVGKYYYNDKAANKKSKRMAENPKTGDYIGSGVQDKVWNYKRMVEIASEVWSINLAGVAETNRDIQALRDEQKEGALALQNNKNILDDNRNRYKQLIKDKKHAEVEGKEWDIVMDELKDAEGILEKWLKQQTKDSRKGIIWRGWDTPYKLAINLYGDMLSKVERMRDHLKTIEDSKEKGEEYYGYYDKAIKDIAIEVKKIRERFDERLARALADQEKAEVVAESVLPVYESNKYSVEYSDGIRGGKEFKRESDAIKYAKELSKDKNTQFVSVHKPGMSQTADKKHLIAWFGEGSYWDNVSKKDKEVAELKLENLKVNEEYVEVMNMPVIANALGEIEQQWSDWKNGPLTERGDIKPAQKELKDWIDKWFKDNIK